jgi:all-trans-retinol 13,14-reductase
MTKYNAIIIGGGLGGLTAGATLSKLGKKVLVLEQHYIPGGCATTFKRKEFVMEVGLHEMDGLFDKDPKVEIFDMLEVNKFVKFEQVPELFHLTSDELDFTFPHGTKIAQTLLLEKFPTEQKGIKAFFKLINGVLIETPKIPRVKWKSIFIFPLMPVLFPNVVKASKISVGHWLDQHIENEELKLILTTNLLYYGDDPYSMSLLYFSLAQASYIGGGGHFIKGGSQKLSDYLAQYIQNNGGQVLLGKKVENIQVENGKANGVQFRDACNIAGESVTVYAEAIIVNAAIPNLVKMLPEEYKTLLEDKIENLKEACSLFSIYMGFDIDLKKFGVKHYSTFFYGENVKSLKDVKGNYQGDWNKKAFVFVDYSQVDSGLAPSGKSVGVICTADYLAEWEGLSNAEYKAKKEKVAQSFLQRLEIYFPGILKHLVYYEAGTAKTIQKYTLNPKGTPYGYAQTPSQSGLARISAHTPVKNMYFASAWSFPGGGFTGAILSGFLTAISMNKKIKWGTYDTPFIKDARVVKLIKKEFIAEKTIQLTFEKPNGLYHKAGQYAILRLNQPRKDELDLPFRSLSIVSHPDESTLRFAMRLSESHFKQSCEQMKIGEEATIFGPVGQFVVEEDIKEIVFLISGIGITPVLAMLHDFEKKQFDGKVFLFYSNKTESYAAYHNELQKVNFKNYTYIPVITSKSTRIDDEFLNSHLIGLKNFNYFLVGTSQFIASMKDILIKNGVDILKIKEDDFG